MTPEGIPSWLRRAACVAAIGLVASSAHAHFVPVGNCGNANDTHGAGYGGVEYTYHISTTAVSIAQWQEFLDHTESGQGARVGAFRSDYNYWNTGDRTVGDNAPAVYVGWHNVAQYCNWLTTGSVTTGAYTIDTDPASSTYGKVIGEIDRGFRNPKGVVYVIPTENEWYKAAYFKPDGSGYTLYANGTSTDPPQSSDGTTGWNYNNTLSPSQPWTVDKGTQEQNGTFNMMGNVREWNEAMVWEAQQRHGIRGGAFMDWVGPLRASFRDYITPPAEHFNIGFRPAMLREAVIGAVADAHVHSGATNTNYGTATILQINNRSDNDSFTRKTYIRFDLADLLFDPARTNEATLLLNMVDSGAGNLPDDAGKMFTFGVYGLGDGHGGADWAETALTWNNAPGNDTDCRFGFTDDATLLGTFDVIGKGVGLVEFSSPDLAAFLRESTDGLVTLMIGRHTGQTHPNDYVHGIASREHPAVLGPRLVAAIPEPSSLLLWASFLLSALVGDTLAGRRRRIAHRQTGTVSSG